MAVLLNQRYCGRFVVHGPLVGLLDGGAAQATLFWAFCGPRTTRPVGPVGWRRSSSNVIPGVLFFGVEILSKHKGCFCY
jgi:hypothetical protein